MVLLCCCSVCDMTDSSLKPLVFLRHWGKQLTPLTRTTHRYDARLLLDALPTTAPTFVAADDDDGDGDPTTSAQSSRPDSPAGSGWSDLPSDAEDTFFLTPEETTDLHRTKRLRHLDALRTARLRALSPDADDTDLNADADAWGGSDEEVCMHNWPSYTPYTPNIPNTREREGPSLSLLPKFIITYKVPPFLAHPYVVRTRGRSVGWSCSQTNHKWNLCAAQRCT